MKIIQIVGRSNSGKTTFIRNLIPALSARGTVGAIKHLGHHGFQLEPEKDTTLFHESHAALSGGVDETKSVVVRRERAYHSARSPSIWCMPASSLKRPQFSSNVGSSSGDSSRQSSSGQLTAIDTPTYRSTICLKPSKSTWA